MQLEDPKAPAPPIAGILYDEQAMAEVIAGCVRIVGNERGKTRACEAKVRGLTERVGELTLLGRKLNMWTWLGPLLSGAVTGALGLVVGFAIGFGLRAAPVLP